MSVPTGSSPTVSYFVAGHIHARVTHQMFLTVFSYPELTFTILSSLVTLDSESIPRCTVRALHAARHDRGCTLRCAIASVCRYLHHLCR